MHPLAARIFSSLPGDIHGPPALSLRCIWNSTTRPQRAFHTRLSSCRGWLALRKKSDGLLGVLEPAVIVGAFYFVVSVLDGLLRGGRRRQAGSSRACTIPFPA